MTNYSKPLAAIILSAAAFASISTANAASYSSSVDLTKTIEFSQQDLASTEGLNDIHNRVVEAASDICTPNRNTRYNPNLNRDIQSCIADTVDQTFENTQVDKLTSYHQSLIKKSQYRKNNRAFTSN